MFEVGDKIGHYEILAHLKAGGMATLYLARDRKVAPKERLVAIKAVHAHLSEDSEMMRMFFDEARLAARIAHPNVVRIDALAEAMGVQFLVMEYVHGASLGQLLNRLYKAKRRMAPELATYIAMHVAEGLHAAHEAKGEDGQPLGVVHRDVSPQNILLSHEGGVKLIDFGIAKAAGRLQRTHARRIKGKLRYMAPEQARGLPVDRRTDVYALGIVLWEMLTMRPLFWEENDFELLERVRSPMIEPPSRYSSRIPPALDTAVLRALSQDPNQRPATTLAFREELSRAMPLADALDAEQVAELLSIVVGDEMERALEDLSDEASAAFGIEVLSDPAAGRSRGGTTATIASDVLRHLTQEHQVPVLDERMFPNVTTFLDAAGEDALDGATVPTPPPDMADEIIKLRREVLHREQTKTAPAKSLHRRIDEDDEEGTTATLQHRALQAILARAAGDPEPTPDPRALDAALDQLEIEIAKAQGKPPPPPRAQRAPPIAPPITPQASPISPIPPGPTPTTTRKLPEVEDDSPTMPVEGKGPIADEAIGPGSETIQEVVIDVDPPTSARRRYRGRVRPKPTPATDRRRREDTTRRRVSVPPPPRSSGSRWLLVFGVVLAIVLGAGLGALLR